MLNCHLTQYWQPRPGCPRLFLAPMEGLNDQPWRKAYSRVIGGFDETCCEFIRMPNTGHAKSLARAFHPDDTFPIPMAAQIMGETPESCAAISYEVQQRGAWRIDLNCGCPSSTVVGKGAGSSLLKTPYLIHEIVCEMKKVCTVPITVKMRAGYEDESLFERNLEAIESAGASFITIHPRTRVQGYSGQAKWELIAKAKRLVKIPIVASGDVTSASKALELYSTTSCDGIMIGRGAFIDPWIFWKIRHAFSHESFEISIEQEAAQLEQLLSTFLEHLCQMSPRGQLGRLKQVIRFLQHSKPPLQLHLKDLLIHDRDPKKFITDLINLWREHAQDPPITSR